MSWVHSFSAVARPAFKLWEETSTKVAMQKEMERGRKQSKQKDSTQGVCWPVARVRDLALGSGSLTLARCSRDSRKWSWIVYGLRAAHSAGQRGSDYPPNLTTSSNHFYFFRYKSLKDRDAEILRPGPELIQVFEIPYRLEAHRLLHHSTGGSRVIHKKRTWSGSVSYRNPGAYRRL